MCYFNPTQCTKNGENIAIDYKYQPLWAQTQKLLYTLDWWKKNCSEKCWNGMEFMGALSSHVCKYAPMGSISIPFPALFRAISFFFISPTCTKVLVFGPIQVSTYLFIFLKKSNVVMQIVTYSFVSSWINGENIAIND